MIQAARAASAEQVAREVKAKEMSLSAENQDGTPQITRSPDLKDQSRRASKSGVARASFQSAQRRTRGSQPRSHQRVPADDYIKFDR